MLRRGTFGVIEPFARGGDPWIQVQDAAIGGQSLLEMPGCQVSLAQFHQYRGTCGGQVRRGVTLRAHFVSQAKPFQHVCQRTASVNVRGLGTQ